MKRWPRFLEIQSGGMKTVGLVLVPAWLLGSEAVAHQAWLAVLLVVLLAVLLGGYFCCIGLTTSASSSGRAC